MLPDSTNPAEAATFDTTQPARARHLVLIGPMGAGKSTIGRHLARLLELPFVDLDELIESRTGVSIPLIFEVEGEAGFRQRESELLREVLQASARVVLATGGGVILNPANRDWIRRCGAVLYLRTPVAVQLNRLARDTRRPLLQAPDRRERLEQMARDRNPLYESLADMTLDSVADKPNRTARKVAECLGWRAPVVPEQGSQHAQT
jgi:shikimate kinase